MQKDIVLKSEVNEALDKLVNKVNDLQEYVDALEKENERLIDKVKSQEDWKTPLSVIIDAAERWDLGIKGWRTLETKQDLIKAIRKEVLYE